MCRFLSPLLFCTIVTLLVCNTASAQRTVPRPPLQTVPRGIIQHFQILFQSSYVDNSGSLSSEELLRFFANGGPENVAKEIVAEEFADKKELELIDLLHAYAIYSQRAQEADQEKDRQIRDLQAQVAKRMRQAAPQKAQEEPVEEAKPDVVEQVAEVAEEATEVAEAVGTPDDVAEAESPHAELFQYFDTNSDGRIAGDERELVPESLYSDLFRGRDDSEIAEASLADFHRELEKYKSDYLRVRKKGEAEKRYHSYFREMVSAKPSEDIASKESESDEAVNPSETADKAETETLKFEIVLLERATREAPARTLAEEALEVSVKGKANSAKLAARIAPLLSAEANRVTRLVDYFQAHTLAGGQVEVQKGSRPNRGQNQGTLVKIAPLAGEGASVDVSMTFEKSFFAPADLPAPEEDEAAEEEGEASEAAMKKAEEAFLAQLSERERQFLSQLRQRGGRSSTENGGQSSPDLDTLTAQGSLALTPGHPAVFSEMAGRSENGFREYVILIELTRP